MSECTAHSLSLSLSLSVSLPRSLSPSSSFSFAPLPEFCRECYRHGQRRGVRRRPWTRAPAETFCTFANSPAAAPASEAPPCERPAKTAGREATSPHARDLATVNNPQWHPTARSAQPRRPRTPLPAVAAVGRRLGSASVANQSAEYACDPPDPPRDYPRDPCRHPRDHPREPH